jgi:hypothetical protein
LRVLAQNAANDLQLIANASADRRHAACHWHCSAHARSAASRNSPCGQCQSAVHLIEKKSELGELARQGKCVAILQKDAGHTASSSAAAP